MRYLQYEGASLERGEIQTASVAENDDKCLFIQRISGVLQFARVQRQYVKPVPCPKSTDLVDRYTCHPAASKRLACCRQ